MKPIGKPMTPTPTPAREQEDVNDALRRSRHLAERQVQQRQNDN
jgi:hypothetical protein